MEKRKTTNHVIKKCCGKVLVYLQIVKQLKIEVNYDDVSARFKKSTAHVDSGKLFEKKQEAFEFTFFYVGLRPPRTAQYLSQLRTKQIIIISG